MMQKTIKKSFAVLLALLTVVFIMPISSHAVTTDIPSDAVEFNGHYYKIYESKIPWKEAKQSCEDNGGYLVTITSKEENEFVKQIVADSGLNSIAYGGYYDADSDSWKWVTGERFEFTDWGPNEPNNNALHKEYFLEIYSDPNYTLKWNDCNENTLGGYICEWGKPISASTSEVAARIIDLCKKLGISNPDIYSGAEQRGIYFTTDKAKATKNDDPRTINLSVAKAQWFIDLFGSGVSSSSFSQGNTCNGFAKFAQWYIFSGDPSKSVPVTWQGYKTSNKENAGNCVIGDRISFNSPKKDDYHQAIYLGCNDTGFIVLDSNSVVCPSNIVAIHTINYSTFPTFDCGRAPDVVPGIPGDSEKDTATDDNESTTEHVTEQTENVCGYCGKVHGTSFKDVLMKIFHKSFYFFAKLFGLKK